MDAHTARVNRANEIMALDWMPWAVAYRIAELEEQGAPRFEGRLVKAPDTPPGRAQAPATLGAGRRCRGRPPRCR